MFRARPTWLRFSNRLKFIQSKPLCTTNNNNDNKIHSSLSKYEQQYRQLDNLDFMSASNILFTDPPKKKKFGFDFHLVQFFFACLPSLAVYLVAQYARREMKKMDAELEKKKREEEEKAKEMELKAAEEKAAGSDPQTAEVKVRLDKLEEAVKEIVVEWKKQSGGSITKDQEDGNEKKHVGASELDKSVPESSNYVEKDQLSTQESVEVTPSLNQGKECRSAPVPNSLRQDQKSKTQNGGPSQDAK
ncbi:hypothetical protein CFOL_v3_15866 [Cephalotus follicularis]|uniref:Uncharacterized protein n=1 Tax=Cephalotus follicularis TaxID=3775 RepID=A0A1Q3BX02_CEPFO|nr:hypothetical protein CFOL_v3_15866 [Cephalotus follicularis]